MEPRKCVRAVQKVALPGTLLAFLVAQGALSLACYSCHNLGDGRCREAHTWVQNCDSKYNVCVEATAVLIIDNQRHSIAIKGCDRGLAYYQESSQNLFGTFFELTKVHACTKDLCNNRITEDFLLKSPDNWTVNSSSVLRGQECYSCFSLSQEDCSSQKAALIRCPEEGQVCYDGTSDIAVGNTFSLFTSYFFKTCSSRNCPHYWANGQYFMHNQTGSCCEGDVCNGLQTTQRNGGLGASIHIALLILAACLAVIEL